jgi:hypothetical protein
MKGQTKVKRPASARKRLTKCERMMTDKDSSKLLESASQALAMVQGSKLVGGRISARRHLRQPGRPKRKNDAA